MRPLACSNGRRAPMLDQGSDEWLRARLGKVTASRVADVISKTKSGYSASRANYAAQIIAERLSGHPQESFLSGPMQWGIEKEQDAKDAYSFFYDVAVEPAGFVIHPSISDSGASPDGFVGIDGLVEIKCPNTATHIDTLLCRSAPSKYITQMQWQMACTRRAWCDFVSFDPRLPADMQVFVARVFRDDLFIAELEEEVCKFLSEVDERMAALITHYRGGGSRR